jgi:endonuclease III
MERERILEKRAGQVIERLKEQYPSATSALSHKDPFQLLVATILSAQCTDERVNMVTPELFRLYPGPAEMASADLESLEEIIHSTGFYRNKARSIRLASEHIVKDFQGSVPANMEDLLSLPGVARKTANVVLGTWFRKPEGVVVDTHVKRISALLEFTAKKDPIQIEKDLMALLPREEWIGYSHRIILHGRETCKARKPLCNACILSDLCPSAVLE